MNPEHTNVAHSGVTVVIPALDEVGNLSRLLPALLGATHLVREVIVSDGGSRDDTATLARSLGARVIEGEAGRGLQLARGVNAAGSDWLWLLHADTTLPAGWDTTLAAWLSTADPARAYHGRLRFDSPRKRARFVELVVHARCAMLGLPYGDQSLLIHRALLAAVGGVPMLKLMEDVALARRLGRRRLASMPLVVTTNAAAYERDGWLRRSAANFRRLVLFLIGTDASRLSGGYRRRDASPK